MEITYKKSQQQIIMDYDDFTRVMDEVIDKVAAKFQAIAAAPAGSDDQELLTPKDVAALFSVTQKTLHVWDKTGFLPRIRSYLMNFPQKVKFSVFSFGGLVELSYLCTQYNPKN